MNYNYIRYNNKKKSLIKKIKKFKSYKSLNYN